MFKKVQKISKKFKKLQKSPMLIDVSCIYSKKFIKVQKSSKKFKKVQKKSKKIQKKGEKKESEFFQAQTKKLL